MKPSAWSHLSWFRAGWSADHPASSSGVMLAAAALIGLLIVGVSYSFTLVAMPPWKRCILCALRLAIWVGVLLILAAPTRTTRIFQKPAPLRPLAVLVDRSDSMTAVDNRGQNRLEDALRRWSGIAGAAKRGFGSVRTFAFARELRPVGAADQAAELTGERTDLFAALENVLEHPPRGGWGGVAALTDGLDTSGTDAAQAEQAVIRGALAAAAPLFFVVGHNRLNGPPFFQLREFTVPSDSAPRSAVPVEAVFDSFQMASRELPLRFLVDGRTVRAETLKLEAGRHLVRWSATTAAEATGMLTVRLEAGNEHAQAEVRIRHPASSNRILYDCGTLDWGYRFLSDILKRGDTFAVTPVFDLPQAGLALPPGAVEHAPFSAAGLRPFGVVILENVSAERIPPEEQAELSRWVGGGGVLLFLTPSDESAQGYAGSELEKMLPVVFSPRKLAESDPFPPADAPSGSGPDRLRIVPARAPELVNFEWENRSPANEIFAHTPGVTMAEETPRFVDYASVARAKPAAEVLARHPTAKGPDGQGAILLAVQPYGRGCSLVLTTDALWRWKLDEESSSRGAEAFWENLFSWALRNRKTGISFDHPPVRASVGSELTFHLTGADNAALSLQAVLGDRHSDLIREARTEASAGYRWKATEPGFWRIEAIDAGEAAARTWVEVDPATASGEHSGAPPAEELLSRLAIQTGGAVLDEAPASWTIPSGPPMLLSELHQPVWDRRWVLAILVGLYCLEMILRRMWKLL